MTRKIGYRCSECDEGNGSLYRDASAYWDEESQSWELGGDGGDCYCGNCGGERTEEVYDLETGEVLKTGPYDHTWRPAAEAQQLWADWYEAKIKEREQEADNKAALETANMLAAAYDS